MNEVEFENGQDFKPYNIAGTMPLVSVIIPCYQQGRYLADAINSVLHQTYPRVEAIVVDDGSTDSTRQVATSFGSAVKYIWQQNGGLPAARNAGLEHCNGQYVVFLDADDMLLPDMVLRMVERLEANPEYGAAQCGYMLTPENGAETDWVCGYSEAGDLFDRLCLGNCLIVHAVMTRMSVLRDAGFFDPSLPASADWDLWLRVAQLGTHWVRVPEVLVKYRQRPRSLGKTFESVLYGTRTVSERGRAMAMSRYPGRAVELEERFRRAWRNHVLRIGVILIAEGRLDECRALFRKEIPSALADLPAEECGRQFWSSFTGQVGIPPDRWEQVWLRYAPNLSGFATLMQELNGRDGYATEVLQNLEPFRSLSLDRERLRAMERSTTWRLGRMITRYKFW